MPKKLNDTKLPESSAVDLVHGNVERTGASSFAASDKRDHTYNKLSARAFPAVKLGSVGSVDKDIDSEQPELRGNISVNSDTRDTCMSSESHISASVRTVNIRALSRYIGTCPLNTRDTKSTKKGGSSVSVQDSGGPSKDLADSDNTSRSTAEQLKQESASKHGDAIERNASNEIPKGKGSTVPACTAKDTGVTSANEDADWASQNLVGCNNSPNELIANELPKAITNDSSKMSVSPSAARSCASNSLLRSVDFSTNDLNKFYHQHFKKSAKCVFKMKAVGLGEIRDVNNLEREVYESIMKDSGLTHPTGEDFSHRLRLIYPYAVTIEYSTLRRCLQNFDLYNLPLTLNKNASWNRIDEGDASRNSIFKSFEVFDLTTDFEAELMTFLKRYSCREALPDSDLRALNVRWMFLRIFCYVEYIFSSYFGSNRTSIPAGVASLVSDMRALLADMISTTAVLQLKPDSEEDPISKTDNLSKLFTLEDFCDDPQTFTGKLIATMISTAVKSLNSLLAQSQHVGLNRPKRKTLEKLQDRAVTLSLMVFSLACHAVGAFQGRWTHCSANILELVTKRLAYIMRRLQYYETLLTGCPHVCLLTPSTLNRSESTFETPVDSDDIPSTSRQARERIQSLNQVERKDLLIQKDQNVNAINENEKDIFETPQHSTTNDRTLTASSKVHNVNFETGDLNVDEITLLLRDICHLKYDPDDRQQKSVIEILKHFLYNLQMRIDGRDYEHLELYRYVEHCASLALHEKQPKENVNRKGDTLRPVDMVDLEQKCDDERDQVHNEIHQRLWKSQDDPAYLLIHVSSILQRERKSFKEDIHRYFQDVFDWIPTVLKRKIYCQENRHIHTTIAKITIQYLTLFKDNPLRLNEKLQSLVFLFSRYDDFFSLGILVLMFRHSADVVKFIVKQGFSTAMNLLEWKPDIYLLALLCLKIYRRHDEECAVTSLPTIPLYFPLARSQLDYRVADVVRETLGNKPPDALHLTEAIFDLDIAATTFLKIIDNVNSFKELNQNVDAEDPVCAPNAGKQMEENRRQKHLESEMVLYESLVHETLASFNATHLKKECDTSINKISDLCINKQNNSFRFKKQGDISLGKSKINNYSLDTIPIEWSDDENENVNACSKTKPPGFGSFARRPVSSAERNNLMKNAAGEKPLSSMSNILKFRSNKFSNSIVKDRSRITRSFIQREHVGYNRKIFSSSKSDDLDALFKECDTYFINGRFRRVKDCSNIKLVSGKFNKKRESSLCVGSKNKVNYYNIICDALGSIKSNENANEPSQNQYNEDACTVVLDDSSNSDESNEIKPKVLQEPYESNEVTKINVGSQLTTKPRRTENNSLNFDATTLSISAQCRSIRECMATKPARKEKHCIPGEVSSTTSHDNIEESANMVHSVITPESTTGLQGREGIVANIVRQPISSFKSVSGSLEPGRILLGIDYSDDEDEGDNVDVSGGKSGLASGCWKVIEEATSSTEVSQPPRSSEVIVFSATAAIPRDEKSILPPVNIIETDGISSASKYAANSTIFPQEDNAESDKTLKPLAKVEKMESLKLNEENDLTTSQDIPVAQGSEAKDIDEVESSISETTDDENKVDIIPSNHENTKSAQEEEHDEYKNCKSVENEVAQSNEPILEMNKSFQESVELSTIECVDFNDATKINVTHQEELGLAHSHNQEDKNTLDLFTESEIAETKQGYFELKDEHSQEAALVALRHEENEKQSNGTWSVELDVFDPNKQLDAVPEFSIADNKEESEKPNLNEKETVEKQKVDLKEEEAQKQVGDEYNPQIACTPSMEKKIDETDNEHNKTPKITIISVQCLPNKFFTPQQHNEEQSIEKCNEVNEIKHEHANDSKEMEIVSTMESKIETSKDEDVSRGSNSESNASEEDNLIIDEDYSNNEKESNSNFDEEVNELSSKERKPRYENISCPVKGEIESSKDEDASSGNDTESNASELSDENKLIIDESTENKGSSESSNDSVSLNLEKDDACKKDSLTETIETEDHNSLLDLKESSKVHTTEEPSYEKSLSSSLAEIYLVNTHNIDELNREEEAGCDAITSSILNEDEDIAERTLKEDYGDLDKAEATDIACGEISSSYKEEEPEKATDIAAQTRELDTAFVNVVALQTEKDRNLGKILKEASVKIPEDYGTCDNLVAAADSVKIVQCQSDMCEEKSKNSTHQELSPVGMLKLANQTAGNKICEERTNNSIHEGNSVANMDINQTDESYNCKDEKNTAHEGISSVDMHITQPEETDACEEKTNHLTLEISHADIHSNPSEGINIKGLKISDKASHEEMSPAGMDYNRSENTNVCEEKLNQAEEITNIKNDSQLDSKSEAPVNDVEKRSISDESTYEGVENDGIDVNESKQGDECSVTIFDLSKDSNSYDNKRSESKNVSLTCDNLENEQADDQEVVRSISEEAIASSTHTKKQDMADEAMLSSADIERFSPETTEILSIIQKIDDENWPTFKQLQPKCSATIATSKKKYVFDQNVRNKKCNTFRREQSESNSDFEDTCLASEKRIFLEKLSLDDVKKRTPLKMRIKRRINQCSDINKEFDLADNSEVMKCDENLAIMIARLEIQRNSQESSHEHNDKPKNSASTGNTLNFVEFLETNKTNESANDSLNDMTSTYNSEEILAVATLISMRRKYSVSSDSYDASNTAENSNELDELESHVENKKEDPSSKPVGPKSALKVCKNAQKKKVRFALEDCDERNLNPMKMEKRNEAKDKKRGKLKKLRSDEGALLKSDNKTNKKRCKGSKFQLNLNAERDIELNEKIEDREGRNTLIVAENEQHLCTVVDKQKDDIEIINTTAEIAQNTNNSDGVHLNNVDKKIPECKERDQTDIKSIEMNSPEGEEEHTSVSRVIDPKCEDSIKKAKIKIKRLRRKRISQQSSECDDQSIVGKALISTPLIKASQCGDQIIVGEILTPTPLTEAPQCEDKNIADGTPTPLTEMLQCDDKSMHKSMDSQLDHKTSGTNLSKGPQIDQQLKAEVKKLTENIEITNITGEIESSNFDEGYNEKSKTDHVIQNCIEMIPPEREQEDTSVNLEVLASKLEDPFKETTIKVKRLRRSSQCQDQSIVGETLTPLNEVEIKTEPNEETHPTCLPIAIDIKVESDADEVNESLAVSCPYFYNSTPELGGRRKVVVLKPSEVILTEEIINQQAEALASQRAKLLTRNLKKRRESNRRELVKPINEVKVSLSVDDNIAPASEPKVADSNSPHRAESTVDDTQNIENVDPVNEPKASDLNVLHKAEPELGAVSSKVAPTMEVHEDEAVFEMDMAADTDVTNRITEGVIADLKLLSPENSLNMAAIDGILSQSQQNTLSSNKSLNKDEMVFSFSNRIEAEVKKNTAELLDSSIEMVLGNSNLMRNSPSVKSQMLTTEVMDSKLETQSTCEVNTCNVTPEKPPPLSKGRLDVLSAEKINQILENQSNLGSNSERTSITEDNHQKEAPISCVTEEGVKRKVITKTLNDVKRISAKVPEALFAGDESESSNSEEMKNAEQLFEPTSSLEPISDMMSSSRSELREKDDYAKALRDDKELVVNLNTSNYENELNTTATISPSEEMNEISNKSEENQANDELKENEETNCNPNELDANAEVPESSFSLSPIADISSLDLPNDLTIPDLLDEMLFEQARQTMDCMISGMIAQTSVSQNDGEDKLENANGFSEKSSKIIETREVAMNEDALAEGQECFLDINLDEVEVAPTTGFDLVGSYTMVDFLPDSDGDFFSFTELGKPQSRSISFSSDSDVCTPRPYDDEESAQTCIGENTVNIQNAENIENSENAQNTANTDNIANIEKAANIESILNNARHVACDHSYNKDMTTVEHRDLYEKSPSNAVTFENFSQQYAKPDLLPIGNVTTFESFSKSKCHPKPYWRSLGKVDEIKASTPKRQAAFESISDEQPKADIETPYYSGVSDHSTATLGNTDEHGELAHSMPILEPNLPSFVTTENRNNSPPTCNEADTIRNSFAAKTTPGSDMNSIKPTANCGDFMGETLVSPPVCRTEEVVTFTAQPIIRIQSQTNRLERIDPSSLIISKHGLNSDDSESSNEMLSIQQAREPNECFVNNTRESTPTLDERIIEYEEENSLPREESKRCSLERMSNPCTDKRKLENVYEERPAKRICSDASRKGLNTDDIFDMLKREEYLEKMCSKKQANNTTNASEKGDVNSTATAGLTPDKNVHKIPATESQVSSAIRNLEQKVEQLPIAKSEHVLAKRLTSDSVSMANNPKGDIPNTSGNESAASLPSKNPEQKVDKCSNKRSEEVLIKGPGPSIGYIANSLKKEIPNRSRVVRISSKDGSVTPLPLDMLKAHDYARSGHGISKPISVVPTSSTRKSVANMEVRSPTPSISKVYGISKPLPDIQASEMRKSVDCISGVQQLKTISTPSPKSQPLSPLLKYNTPSPVKVSMNSSVRSTPGHVTFSHSKNKKYISPSQMIPSSAIVDPHKKQMTGSSGSGTGRFDISTVKLSSADEALIAEKLDNFRHTLPAAKLYKDHKENERLLQLQKEKLILELLEKQKRQKAEELRAKAQRLELYGAHYKKFSISTAAVHSSSQPRSHGGHENAGQEQQRQRMKVQRQHRPHRYVNKFCEIEKRVVETVRSKTLNEKQFDIEPSITVPLTTSTAWEPTTASIDEIIEHLSKSKKPKLS